MTNNDKLETLMHAGLDAEAALRNVSPDHQDTKAGQAIEGHLSCLSCSETLEDATANVKHAIKVIVGTNDKAFSQVVHILRWGLRDAGL